MSAAFSELDWGRFDCHAIVACRGVIAVRPADFQAYRAWLQRHDYAITSLDFGGGLDPAIETLGKLLHWEEQFGYVLTRDRANLDAVRDGFHDGFDWSPRPESGMVFELLNAEAAHTENARWFMGLLSIASEQSLRRLAVGGRFFTTLILDPDSALIGQTFESLPVPGPYWRGYPPNPWEPLPTDHS